MNKEVIITFNNCSDKKIKTLFSTTDITKAFALMSEEKATYLEFAEADGTIVFTISIKEDK